MSKFFYRLYCTKYTSGTSFNFTISSVLSTEVDGPGRVTDRSVCSRFKGHLDFQQILQRCHQICNGKVLDMRQLEGLRDFVNFILQIRLIRLIITMRNKIISFPNLESGPLLFSHSWYYTLNQFWFCNTHLQISYCW